MTLIAEEHDCRHCEVTPEATRRMLAAQAKVQAKRKPPKRLYPSDAWAWKGLAGRNRRTT